MPATKACPIKEVIGQAFYFGYKVIPTGINRRPKITSPGRA